MGTLIFIQSEGGGVRLLGIVCEVGYSDLLNKTQRDIGL